NIETSAREVKMLDPEKIEQKVPHFAEALKQRHGEDRWKRVLEKTAEMMVNLGDSPELPYEEFQQIEQAVRLSLGDRDHMVSIEETIEAYRQLPKSELAILPGTGHPLESIPVDYLCTEITRFFTVA
ncbi:MAG: alpha/beta fold hydrolase, partial [Candidatus Kapaibacterium sp.]